jgi:hypothetical protein
VVVLDDLHGRAGLLDLIEHIADFSRDAPILLLCMARAGAARPPLGLGGGKLNATNVLLEPLSADETEELIERFTVGARIDALYARGSSNLPAAIRCLSARCWRCSPIAARERLGRDRVPPTIRRCSLRGSTSSTIPSVACWSEAPSRSSVPPGAVVALAPEEAR